MRWDIILSFITFMVVAVLVYALGRWMVGRKPARSDLSIVTWRSPRERRDERVGKAWKALDFLNRRRHLGLEVRRGYDDVTVYDYRGHVKLHVIVEIMGDGSLKTLMEFDSCSPRGYPDGEEGMDLLTQEASDHLLKRPVIVA